MTDTLFVTDGMVVSIHYTLKLSNGETVDSSEGSDPLAYLHGAGNIVPGLEGALSGKATGSKLDVKVDAADGYGERDLSAIRQVPLSAFPAQNEVLPGMRFAMQSQDGHPIYFVVSAVNGDQVTIDMNHPLAGETLHFAVEVVAVRAATDEEKTHGHPHMGSCGGHGGCGSHGEEGGGGCGGKGHHHHDDDDDHDHDHGGGGCGHGHGHGHGGCSH